jgi:hypothetical protein
LPIDKTKLGIVVSVWACSAGALLVVFASADRRADPLQKIAVQDSQELSSDVVLNTLVPVVRAIRPFYVESGGGSGFWAVP